MELDLKNAKIELIQWLTTIEDISVIEKLMKLRKTEVKDWGDELSKAEVESIQVGLNEADNGQIKSYEEVKKVYEKWL